MTRRSSKVPRFPRKVEAEYISTGRMIYSALSRMFLVSFYFFFFFCQGPWTGDNQSNETQSKDVIIPTHPLRKNTSNWKGVWYSPPAGVFTHSIEIRVCVHIILACILNKRDFCYCTGPFHSCFPQYFRGKTSIKSIRSTAQDGRRD